MSLTSMEVKIILAVVILARLFEGIGANLFHRASDDPLKEWSLSVYRTIPIKESTSLMQKCAICTSDASCSGFTSKDLNLLLFDLNGNSSLSQLAGVYVNLGKQTIDYCTLRFILTNLQQHSYSMIIYIFISFGDLSQFLPTKFTDPS